MIPNSGQSYYDAVLAYTLAAYGRTANAPGNRNQYRSAPQRPYAAGGTLPLPTTNPYYMAYALGMAGVMGTQQPKPDPESLKSSWSSTAVRGYRTWAEPGDGDNGVLRGAIWTETAWNSPTTTARCVRRNGGPCDGPHPNPLCDCGLYAWHLPDEVFASKVFGVVEGAGRVLWAKAGWRAERTRIVALHHPSARIAGMIAARHPEAELFDSVDGMLAAYPPLIDPTRVYGPQGAAVRRIVAKAATVADCEVHEMNLPWVFKNTDECQRRQAASTAAHRTLYTENRPPTPPWMYVNAMAGWAYRAVMVADRIPAVDYRLLMAPWLSVFPDPLPDYCGPVSPAGVVEAFPEASDPSGANNGEVTT